MKKIGLIVLIYLAAMSSILAATRPWAYEQDPGLGFQFSYPICLTGQKATESLRSTTSPQETLTQNLWSGPGTMRQAKRPVSSSIGCLGIQADTTI